MKKILVVMTLLSSVLAFAKNDETSVFCWGTNPNGTLEYRSADFVRHGVPQLLDVKTEGTTLLFEGEVLEVSDRLFTAKDNTGNIVFSLKITKSVAYYNDDFPGEPHPYFYSIIALKGSYPRLMYCSIIPAL